jgi:hypothetical protein
MGTPLSVTIPPVGGSLVSSPGASLRIAHARMEGEARFSREHRRFLISVFAEDRPGILRGVVSSVATGFELPPVPRPIRFSLDGSLSAAIHGTFSSVLVVRAYCESRAGQAMLRWVPEELLVDALASRVRAQIGDCPVEVYPLRHSTADLFSGRRFSEYRFGSGRADYDFGSVARDFAIALGDSSVPIAYLHFPDSWRDQPAEKWLRVGVAFDHPLSSSIEVDIRAAEIAESHQCLLKKYDPSIDGRGLGERFVVLEDARLEGEQASDAAQSFSADVVFVEGEARPGYVAAMLRGSDPGEVLGGSMTVLAGHTVATWIIKGGRGQAVIDRLAGAHEARAEDDPRPPDRELLSPQLVADPDGLRSHGEFWVCWRCGEKPGVLDAILEVVWDHFGGETEVSIEREVSRVVAEGDTCAGKMLVSFLSAPPESMELSALRDAIARRIAFALEGWAPRRSDWIGAPVLVESYEPGEDPWATLVVE